MSRIMLCLFCLGPVLALPAVGPIPPPAMLKCGGSLAPNNKPIVAVDGVIRPQEFLQTSELPREDIYRIDIVCMNPKDSTFNRTEGWAVVSIWTKQGPAPRVPEALDVIRDAQDAHIAKHGRYILALEDMEFPESMKPVRITLNADAKGWIAHTTLPRLLRTCAMFDGAVATPLPTGPRKSACDSDR